MAEYVMPPEMEDFMEACGDVAMDNFDPAAFEADPSAAFSGHNGCQWTLWVNLECLLI